VPIENSVEGGGSATLDGRTAATVGHQSAGEGVGLVEHSLGRSTTAAFSPVGDDEHSGR